MRTRTYEKGRQLSRDWALRLAEFQSKFPWGTGKLWQNVSQGLPSVKDPSQVDLPEQENHHRGPSLHILAPEGGPDFLRLSRGYQFAHSTLE